MGEIYSGAAEVVIWLGDSSHERILREMRDWESDGGGPRTSAHPGEALHVYTASILSHIVEVSDFHLAVEILLKSDQQSEPRLHLLRLSSSFLIMEIPEIDFRLTAKPSTQSYSVLFHLQIWWDQNAEDQYTESAQPESDKFIRGEAMKYDKDDSPDVPHLTFEIPDCKSVRKITFNILSHDQGWDSSPRQDHGTYQGSHTWFEVGVMPADPSSSADVARHCIQRNVHAKRESTRHVVSWDCETVSPGLREWMKSLALGTVARQEAMLEGGVFLVSRVMFTLMIYLE
ncbi:ankyrin repeat protein [Colletotrichum plurivorum]|uniref:Ankyrin repeat protein n=1 Tax=Colletotrichum plurivorum TaxID=2175906 RepID=A0A8H6NQE3_9PEZI|nr:ankyrin repeat protein [Colletotrichum plurivorum]